MRTRIPAVGLRKERTDEDTSLDRAFGISRHDAGAGDGVDHRPARGIGSCHPAAFPSVLGQVTTNGDEAVHVIGFTKDTVELMDEGEALELEQLRVTYSSR